MELLAHHPLPPPPPPLQDCQHHPPPHQRHHPPQAGVAHPRGELIALPPDKTLLRGDYDQVGKTLIYHPVTTIHQLVVLRKLNLVGNQLRTLDKEVMEPLASLEVLLLDSNQLEDINGRQWLNVEREQIVFDVWLIIEHTCFALMAIDFRSPLIAPGPEGAEHHR